MTALFHDYVEREIPNCMPCRNNASCKYMLKILPFLLSGTSSIICNSIIIKQNDLSQLKLYFILNIKIKYYIL